MRGSTWSLSVFLLVISIHYISCAKKGADAKGDPELEKGILEEHNKLRKKYKAPPLSLSKELSDKARLAAKRAVDYFVSHGNFQLEDDDVNDKNWNDNVWAMVSFASTKLSAKKVMEKWLAEEKSYDFNSKPAKYNPATGHFTQMIWASTDELGVGVATGRTSLKHFVYVVYVRYSPPGNIIGDEDIWADNVRAPK